MGIKGSTQYTDDEHFCHVMLNSRARTSFCPNRARSAANRRQALPRLSPSPMGTMMVLCVRTIVAPTMEDEPMDEARIHTIAMEMTTLDNQLRKYPPDEPDLMITRMVRYVSLLNELSTMRLTHLYERVSRIEALINRLAPSDQTESPPIPPSDR